MRHKSYNETMNIITPIDKVEEVKALLEIGVGEFYGGFVPQQWLDRYTLNASMNQRYFESAQIKTLGDLKYIIDEIHRFGRKFFFTMNGTFYTTPQYEMIAAFLPELKKIGVDGIIAADIGLILLVNRSGLDIPVHISTLGKAYNHKTVEMYGELGIRRIVFPRHLTFDEMKAIEKKCPDMEYDIFMMIGKCPNIEGYCTFQHNSPKKRWPCEIDYEITASDEAAGRFIESQRQWSIIDRRNSCGLCALKKLGDFNVKGLKIVGRGSPMNMKVANVKLLKYALSLLEENLSDTEYYRRIKVAYSERFGVACAPQNCYYPEFFNL